MFQIFQFGERRKLNQPQRKVERRKIGVVHDLQSRIPLAVTIGALIALKLYPQFSQPTHLHEDDHQDLLALDRAEIALEQRLDLVIGHGFGFFGEGIDTHG